MTKANDLIIKASKYFWIMQLVYFELFFSVRQTFRDKPFESSSVFSQIYCDSRSFKTGKVIQGLSVTQGLSTSLLRLTTKRLKGFSLHEKQSFPLKISSLNVTKSAENCGFGHIY